jgi:hypothetical protein
MVRARTACAYIPDTQILEGRLLKKSLPLKTIAATGHPDFAGMISSANQLPKLSP